jgi:hypothetical protein
VRWQSGAANSDLIVRNGLQIAILDHEGLSVRVTLTVQNYRQVALVGVINQTPNRVEVVPSEMTFVLLDPEGKTFPYQDPDKIAAKARNAAALASVLAGILSYQRSYTTGAIHGTSFYSTTTTYPNVSGSALALAGQIKEDEASNIQRDGLRENTLVPGEHVAGAVFFAAPKHYEKDYKTRKLETLLRVPVGDYMFEFPFWWELPPPAPRRFWDRADDVVVFPLWWKAKK